MRIAKNYKRPLDQGWFLVRNRTGLERQVGEKHLDIEQAHEAEESLFSTEPWVNLPSDRLGCRKLRGFLTSRFASHIQKEFPKIQNEILAKVDEANAQVRALGPPRNTPKQQRRYLHDIAHQYNRFVENCISGRHLRLQGPSVDEHSNINLQREIAKDSFLEQMTNRGCSWPFLRLEDESAYKYDIHADRSFQDMREDDEEAGRPSDQVSRPCCMDDRCLRHLLIVTEYLCLDQPSLPYSFVAWMLRAYLTGARPSAVQIPDPAMGYTGKGFHLRSNRRGRSFREIGTGERLRAQFRGRAPVRPSRCNLPFSIR